MQLQGLSNAVVGASRMQLLGVLYSVIWGPSYSYEGSHMQL